MEFSTPYAVNKLLGILAEKKETPSDLVGTLRHIAQIARVFFDVSACTIFAINPITHHLVASQTDPHTMLENDVIYDQVQLEKLMQHAFDQVTFFTTNLDETPDYRSFLA